MNDLISIVLPVYNGEKYLRESIDSIIAQTYTNWELLILDDCSTDSSPDIAKEYESRDSRIRYYRNENNLRLPRNLNKGFSLAKGNYLTWTSDDNRYKPSALEKMHSALTNNDGAQFVFASCAIIDALGKEVECMMVSESKIKTIVGQNCVGACFMYTRKVYETIGDYNPELTLVEDYDYWQRIFMQFKAVAISEKLYEYRWHDGALTSTMRKDKFNEALEKMLLANRPGFGKIDSEQSYYYYKGLYNCRKNLGDKNNPYRNKYEWYYFVFKVRYRYPRKIKRLLKRREKR